MMGRSPKCYIPSFVEIALSVPEKYFEGFFTIQGRGGHLGHVTSINVLIVKLKAKNNACF